MADQPRRKPWIVAAGLLVVTLVVLDQVTKSAVFSWLVPPPAGLSVDEHGHQRKVLVDPWLAFMTSCNDGAAFGSLDQVPHLLVGGRILAVVLLSWLILFRTDPRHRAVFWAMALVLAGAIGNLIDNLWSGCLVPGHPYLGVRDFVDVWFVPLGWDYHFPSFNVADSCITCGAILWIASGLFHREHAAEEPLGEAPADG